MRRLHLRRQESCPRRLLEEDVPEHEHDSSSAHGESSRATKVSFVMSANEDGPVLPVPTDSSMALRQIKPHMVPTRCHRLNLGARDDVFRERGFPPTPSTRHHLATQAAFVRFSGPPPSEQRVAKERARLEEALAKHGCEVRRPEETLTYATTTHSLRPIC